MGDRAQARIDFHVPDGDRTLERSIFLYTHWQGRELPGIVAGGVQLAVKAGRGNDDPYFTRIVIAALEEAHSDTLDTGVGVAPYFQDNDGYPLIVLDPKFQTVTFEGPYGGDQTEFTFEEFVEFAGAGIWQYGAPGGTYILGVTS